MKKNLILVQILFLLHSISCLKSKTLTNTNSHTSSHTNLNSRLTSGAKISFKFSEMARRFHMTENTDNNKIILAPVQNQNQTSFSNNGNIFWEGWIKFFKYELDANLENKPRAFFKNNQYYTELKEDAMQHELNPDDKIKSEFHFYAYIFKDTVNIMSNKKRSFDSTIEVIDIPNILKTKRLNYDGGIIDRGAHQEGYCLEIVISRKGNKPNTEYLICLDQPAEKKIFMTKLKDLRILFDREHGLEEFEALEESGKDESVSNMFKISEEQVNPDGTPFDGYWVTIQDWTECNLKCGGGESFLQRVCVPPVNGGKDCEGQPLLSKKCNTDPCPESCFLKTQNTEVKKPFVKVENFMNRPQRYEKCKIQESDLLYFRNLEDLSIANIEGKAPQMVRVVMNNRTISIFESDDYTSNIATFSIKQTKLKPSKVNPYCFTIYDVEIPKKNAELCAFDFKDSEMIKEWQQHYEEFKTICWTKLEGIIIEKESEEEKEKLKVLKQDISLKYQAKLNELLHDKKESELETKLETARSIGFDIIKKEITLEEKIRKEEAEKEKQEIESMKLECDKAEKKSKILSEAVREKENESTFLMKETNMKAEMKEITRNTLDALSDTRKEFIKSMNHMKMKTKLEKFMLKKKLLAIKMQMTSQMKDKYKKGNSQNCNLIKNDSNKRINFCKLTYHDDPTEYQNCLGENFCIACCNIQFGSALVDERESCYQQVCEYLKN